MRLLVAIDAGRSGFEDLKRAIAVDRLSSTRTLRRYLATLADAGFPWYYDRGQGCYRFPDGHALRRVELSGAELVGLDTLRSLGARLGGTIAGSIEEVARRLTSAAQTDARPALNVQLAPAAGLDDRWRATFERLQRALRARQSVRFRYVDKHRQKTDRHVDPYGFVLSAGRVYVVAHDRGRGARRVFALDGITDVRLAPNRFSLPADFDVAAFAGASVSGTIAGGPVAHVSIRFAAIVAGAAVAERVVREREIHEQADGSVIVSYGVAEISEIVRWSLKWGTEAEILAPPEARLAAAEIVAALAERYRARPAKRADSAKR
ncbi:MAG: helix-turn-helix transcriptional regulator [Vulcanimicrobiaceae bacterium]